MELKFSEWKIPRKPSRKAENVKFQAHFERDAVIVVRAHNVPPFLNGVKLFV